MSEKKVVHFHRCPDCQEVFAPFKKHCPNCNLLLSSPGLLKLWLQLNKFNWVQYLIFLNLFWFTATFLTSWLLLRKLDPGFFNLPAPSNRLLYFLGAAERNLVFEGQWWRLLSSSFLHGGLVHIAFNLLWLNQLTRLATQMFSLYKMLWLVLFTAICSSLVAIIWNSQPVIGASGVACGLLAAVAVHSWFSKQFMFSRQLFMWLVILLIPGFLFHGISNAAHIGGVLSGGLYGAGLFFLKDYRTPLSWWLVSSLLAIGILAYVTFNMLFNMLALFWQMFQAFS